MAFLVAVAYVTVAATRVVVPSALRLCCVKMVLLKVSGWLREFAFIGSEKVAVTCVPGVSRAGVLAGSTVYRVVVQPRSSPHRSSRTRALLRWP
jgi:hypothetical protein